LLLLFVLVLFVVVMMVVVVVVVVVVDGFSVSTVGVELVINFFTN
jgi:hypothetical protein